MPLYENRKTILVVDDSVEMLRYFRTLLEIDDYQVATASNGVDAIQALRDGFDPDVVILDWQMPRLNGLRTLKRLRKLRPELKVIICSGRVDARMQEQNYRNKRFSPTRRVIPSRSRRSRNGTITRRELPSA